MSEYKFGSSLSLGIWVQVVRILKLFWVWSNSNNLKIEFEYQTTRFICNYDTNYLENFTRTISGQLGLDIDIGFNHTKFR